MCKKIIIILFVCFSVISYAKEDVIVDLHHWWRMPSEQDALFEIENAVTKRGATVEKFVLDDFESHRASIIERVGFGYLPAVTHWLAGSELLALKEEGVLLNLPEKVADVNIKEVLYPRVLSEITSKDMLSALPVGIHIQNTAFYSSKIFNELNLQPPKNWDEFFQQAPIIQDAGYTPLAVADNGWQVGFLVDAFLLDKGGVQGIEAVRYGKGDLNSWRPLLVKLFDFLKALKPYANPKWEANTWNENAKLVASGDAAMQVIGDYVEAVMRFNDFTHGADYTYQLAPGNKGAMIYGVDVFALLKVDDESRQMGQQVLIETVLDRQVQKNFIEKKGGLPVRRDVDVSDINSSRAALYQMWKDDSVAKVKMPGGNSRLRFKALESMALDVWMAPQKYDAQEMADKFIALIESVE